MVLVLVCNAEVQCRVFNGSGAVHLGQNLVHNLNEQLVLKLILFIYPKIWYRDEMNNW